MNKLDKSNHPVMTLLIDIINNYIQVGGNRNALEFFKSQPDWSNSMSIEQKYNTKAAALYRDKVSAIFKLFVK